MLLINRNYWVFFSSKTRKREKKKRKKHRHWCLPIIQCRDDITNYERGWYPHGNSSGHTKQTMILQVLSDPCWTVRLTVIHRHKNGGYFFDLAAGLSICSTMESEIIGNITKMARNLLRFHIVWCFLSFSVSVGFVRLYYTYAVWHQLSRH